MRIIAGKYRTRTLYFDETNRATRPAKDMVREGVFSALGTYVENATVLDLFAGTGSYGIEALSRNALEATFVETDVKTLELLRKNLSFVQEPTRIYSIDYLRFLQKEEHICSYNLVFIDPPYACDINDIIQHILVSDVIKNECVFVLETDHKLDFSLSNFKVRYYKYGITHITILWRNL